MTNALSELQRLVSLAGVSTEALEWLASHVSEASFTVGERLIRQGETDRDCYFIVDGETEVVRDGVILGVSGVGEPEGELGLFLGTARAATTTAITPVRTLKLLAKDFDELRETQPDLADDIRVNICKHLARRFGLRAFAGVHVDQ
jgi:CRP-like cAMP-binding protein